MTEQLLVGPDLLPFRSEYLADGYRHDQIMMKEARLGDGWATATYQIKQGFMPGDGQFHLTVPLAFVAFAQLAIIYAHVDNGYKEKMAEIYLREVCLRCLRMINEVDDITMRLELKSRRSVAGGIFYVGNVSVQDGAFTGSGSFALPAQAKKIPA